MSANLPSNTMEMLTPLLGGLTRLVRRGTRLDEGTLSALLLGADLEPDAHLLAEVSRWARLLGNLRDAPSEDLRHATIEALLLRGLPEAPVLLATDLLVPVQSSSGSATVAHAAAAANPTLSAAEVLSVDRETLDFGTLAPGEAASANLEVRGGPGRVEVASDQVRVTPNRFGAEPTLLRVEVQPLIGGMLWSSLRLIAETHSQSIEVSILAQWRESPGPATPAQSAPLAPDSAPAHAATSAPGTTAPPASSASSIPGARVVATDGSGTHRTLAEALAQAAEGATIALGSGTHVLGQGVVAPRAVTLAGEGKDVTELVANQGDAALRYRGSGRFELRDLAVRWAGTGAAVADVVVIESGEARIERCRFHGASANASSQGSGLELKGDSRGLVRECEARNNGVGIAVSERAWPTVQANVCEQNLAVGIAYLGEATGSARRNVCRLNGSSGILVTDSAQTLLNANVCAENGEHGIEVLEQSAPSLTANSCSDNAADGIYIASTAKPTLRDNECRGNLGVQLRDTRG